MGIVTESKAYATIRVRSEEDICFIQIHRPEANNTISDALIEEFSAALSLCEESSKIVVVEGLPEVFCFGADFKALDDGFDGESGRAQGNPGPLYDLWTRLASGPFISIAHVRGKVNAGGVGFAAACDVVLCEEKAVFSLSEMLFGLMPACVLPFLIRRMGYSRANYMTLMTQPVPARQALDWGLADACEENSESLLRKHLLRFRRLGKPGIGRYKRYMGALDAAPEGARAKAIAANMEVFSDKENLGKISRYVKTGQFPWEARA